jgi:hypothetical protein
MPLEMEGRCEYVRYTSIYVCMLGVELTTRLQLLQRSRMRGAIPSTLQYIFTAWCLVQHRDNFTFYIFYLLLQLHCMSMKFPE